MGRECPICQQLNPDGANVCQSCGSPLTLAPSQSFYLHLPPKTALNNGRYIIEDVLGSGGFAITYKATDTLLGRKVVIKEFFFSDGCIRVGRSVQIVKAKIEVQDFEEMKQKFLEEAKVLAKLKHRGIVEVYDFFEDNNTAYIVMEFVEGKPLSKILQERGGVMEEREAMGYIQQVCEALRVVHGAGYLHRDIKPENIMVCDDGRVVLIDFGAARQFMAGKTGSYSVILTPGYAPLEQYARKVRLGPYTDIYALGATMYHLVTGQVPIEATDRVQGVGMGSPREINPRVSEVVSEAVMRALEIEAAKRPQSVDEFLDLLEGKGAVQKAVSQPAPQQAVSPPPTPSPPAVQPSRRKKKLAVWVVVSGAIVLSLVGVAWKPIEEIREKKKGVECGSNLRQLLLGVMQYSQDYDEKLPLAHNWAPALMLYIRSSEAYRCPSRKELAIGYAYNRSLSGLRLNEIANPAETVCLFESNLGRGLTAFSFYGNAGNSPSDYGESWIKGGVHFGGNYVGFVDGHCRWYRWDRGSELFRNNPKRKTR